MIVIDLIRKIAALMQSEIKHALMPLAPYLRRLSFGFLLVIVSGPFWMIGLFLLLSSLFFYLAELNQFLVASLATAGFSLVLAIVMAIGGYRLIRRPR